MTSAPAPDRRPERRGPLGGRTLRLGRILGIEVFVDSSWILLCAIATAIFTSQLAAAHDDWTTARAFLAGATASLLLALSVLLHELGHGFVSRSLGLRVQSITLFLFGGLAQISGEPTRPRDVFLVAVAGPMVSVLLLLLFLAGGLALGTANPWAETTRAVCQYLAGINLVLVLFNAVPALPLDGGQVLSALVWALTGSRERGIRVASTAGVVFSLGLIGGGVAMAAMGGVVGGLWLAFIGWFLLRAARSLGAQLYIRRRLGRIRLSDALRERSTASRWSSVEDIQDLIGRVRRPVFIVDGEDLLGWVTQDQVRAVAPKKRGFTPVTSILVPVRKLIGLAADRTLLDALSLMNENGLREVAVFEDERPIGAVTREELLHILREGLERGRGAPSASAS